MSRLVFAAAFCAAGFSLGGGCGGGSGSGSGGAPPVIQVVAPADDRCAVVLASPFPPGFDFVPGVPGRVVVAGFDPPAVLPVDVSSTTPRAAFANPPDLGTTIQNAACLGFRDPVPDGIFALNDGQALLTTSGCEGVTLVDPANGAALPFDVDVPAGSTLEALFLPAPGTQAIAPSLGTFACIRPAAGTLDSRGDPIGTHGDCGGPGPSYPTVFTAGVAVAAGRLFVVTSNLILDAGSANPGYAPGTVLIFDLDLAASPPKVGPNAATPFLVTDRFNPIEATAYTTPGGRELVLVTVAGAVGIVADDPGTPEVESGGLALTPGAIEVLDANTLEWVARIPLGLVGLSGDGLTIDPSGRVGVVGSGALREVYLVDLEPLDALPGAPVPPILLDGSDGRVGNADARIFFGGSALAIPKRPDGAGAECGALVTGLAFDAAGTKFYAGEDCDGTLTTVGMDLAGAPPVPVPRDRFGVLGQQNVAAPLGPDTAGEPARPGMIEVRPGNPADYAGPDVFVLLGSPEGVLCGIRIDSL